MRLTEAQFQQELQGENSGQLYARECCANTWYAIGAMRLRRDDRAGAEVAFGETCDRVPRHPLAHAALSVLRGRAPELPASDPTIEATSVPEVVLARALATSLRGSVETAAALIDQALVTTPEGSAFWILPVEPLLHTMADPRWTAPLARLRNRAA